MKNILALIIILAAATAHAEVICFDAQTSGRSAESRDPDVIKALELAVRHTELENTTSWFSSSTVAIGSISSVSNETKAEALVRKAKENLEDAERKAKALEQHDKDIQFIRDVLKRLKKGEK